MSLENPSRIEKMIEALKNFSHWRIVGVLAGVLVLIGLVLFAAESCGDWREGRKQNVNMTLANIANREKVIANLKEQQAAETQAVNTQTQEYMEAINATDATRAETNKALANMANAANGNGNISVEQLKEKLRGL